MRGAPGSKVLSLVALAALAGCGAPTVVRVVEGKPVEGRFIPYEAYARYARAAAAEAAGDLDAALNLYGLAAEADPESAEIWTRLGAVRCAIAGMHAPAEEAFARAEELDASYAPLYRERARCAGAAGQLGAAIELAQRAIALDPDREETPLLYASLLERAGNPEKAAQVLGALVIRDPASIEGWLARYELAQRQHDPVIAERAARELRTRAPRLAERLTVEQQALAPMAEVDAALGRDDLEAAQRWSRRAHLGGAELAVRAAALGRARLARAQAELVLGADPASSSARIALAVAADLMGDTSALDAALAPAPEGSITPPSPLARLLFAELLERRTGREAARAFLGPSDAAARPEAADPLLEAVRQRVRARLGA